MSRFDYANYFAPIAPLAQALSESPDTFWEPTWRQLSRPHEYVLYLGCNVLRTTHLAESIVAVLGAMNVDFITVGGMRFCCGAAHGQAGDEKAGLRLAQHTLDKFAALRPKAVLTYCPTCNKRFDEQLAAGALRFDLPYLHTTQFIAERLDQLPARKAIRRRVGLHAHHGSARAREDAQRTLAILRSIPELDVVELPAGEEWGYTCSSFMTAKIGAERHGRMVADMFATAKDLRCDGLVAVYHSCYRELLRAEREHGLEWLNYIELLPTSLGLGPYPALYKKFVLDGDPEAAFAALAGRAAERGGDLKRLRHATQLHFGGKAPTPRGENSV